MQDYSCKDKNTKRLGATCHTASNARFCGAPVLSALRVA